MDISFEHDDVVAQIIGRRGSEAARSIVLELQKRYDECNREKHRDRARGGNWCSYCFRILNNNNHWFLRDMELQEINDFYAGLFALERERFRK